MTMMTLSFGLVGPTYRDLAQWQRRLVTAQWPTGPARVGGGRRSRWRVAASAPANLNGGHIRVRRLSSSGVSAAAEDSERAHRFAIKESAATDSEVVGVYIVCLSLIFKVTEWLRWQGGMPFATGIPPGSDSVVRRSPGPEGTHRNWR